MQAFRKSRGQSGFTLMELLIVIAVLGLLLGMLIPRLAGVTDDTVDTVCDTNNKGVRYFTQMYYNQKGVLPDGRTNLVDDDGGALPEREDTLAATPDGDAEAMADEFWSRNWPGLYVLDQDEVDELQELGITTLYNLNDTTGTPMAKTTLAADQAVMVMGLAAADASSGPTIVEATDPDGTSLGEVVGVAASAGPGLGNPAFFGRIMLAVNEHCDLVTGGMIQASALCPGAVLNEENFTHKEYILVLPRLEATVDRVADATSIAEGAQIIFTDAEDPAATDARQLEVVFEAMEPWHFDLTCPEGHKWPDYDEDAWVYLSGI